MKRIALTLLLAVALPALADRLPLPADTPASYAAECGSCHLAYPPALLAAGDWRRVMAGLDDHFGTDAAVDAQKRQEITAFLERHAGNAGKAGQRRRSAAHQHDRPFCPQAPRSADQALARSARKIGGQLRSLPSRRRRRQLQRTRHRHSRTEEVSHAENSRLGLAGPPRPLADGRRLHARLADRRQRNLPPGARHRRRHGTRRRHLPPAVGLHRLALRPLRRFRARAGGRQGLSLRACSGCSPRTMSATTRPAAGPSCCCSASAS